MGKELVDGGHTGSSDAGEHLNVAMQRQPFSKCRWESRDLTPKAYHNRRPTSDR